jgi:uncharacterized protein
MPIEYLPLSWADYHQHAFLLADRLFSDKKNVNQIVAISRGGLTFGHLFSDLLRIPISTITIQSYTDIQAQGELKITQELHTPIEGKSVLLVDDVSDTGKTLVRAAQYLKTFHPLSITTVTMFYKPHSVYKPDYYADETSKWILFPYEAGEMLTNIMKQMHKDGKTEKEIRSFVNDLGYPDYQIDFVIKHYLTKTI